jgi:hypothetical protein
MARRPSPAHSNFEAAFTKRHVFHDEDGDNPMR